MLMVWIIGLQFLPKAGLLAFKLNWRTDLVSAALEVGEKLQKSLDKK